MSDISKHYSDIFKEISLFLNDKITSVKQLYSFHASSDFLTLKKFYDFDKTNAKTISSCVKTLAENDEISQYNNDVKNAVIVRIAILTTIFDEGYLSPYLTVPSNLGETLPLILVDLWEGCRYIVEHELSLP